jgi:hypothetical protein
LHLEFTLIFITNFVGFLDIRTSREVFPIEVRSPEIRLWVFSVQISGGIFLPARNP